MNCPHCSFSNPADARFCQNCGRPLERACPNCTTPNPPDARFCKQCGFALTPRPSVVSQQSPIANRQSPLPNLQQYIPAELVAKLEAARASGGMAGERRVVTMLFCDVKGSTALAEHLDPEEWADIINGAFEYLITPVYRYEGTVARLMGDAILAFFGAPIAHEDDPQRAALAGLSIVEGIQRYRDELQQRVSRGRRLAGPTLSLGELALNVRVGINTGLVVVGEFGSDLRLEYTAMGDAVNLASRMEQTAAPGTVQITHDTYRLIAPLFDVAPLGPVEVKGRSEPVQAYRVLGPKARPGRLRGIEGLDAPLIGRDRELAILRDALDALTRGRGQIACLIGEAGLGKSRLIEELKSGQGGALQSQRPAPTTNVVWSEAQGISYDATRPYGLFQQHLRALCGAAESDPPEVVRVKLGQLLQRTSLQSSEHARNILETLLAIEVPIANLQSPISTAQTGDSFKDKLFEVMAHFWRDLAGQNPIVLVFDDLHWSDPASIELLLRLFQLADEAAVFFLCAFRGRRQADAWRAKQVAESDYPHRYQEVTLQPLSATESDTLVNSLLTVAELPDTLRQLILKKAEGNPFFVEEVVRELIETAAVVRIEGEPDQPVRWQATAEVNDIAIPDNLQALITARIDRLDEGARRTLQVAAVIGRSFTYPVLKMILESPATIDRHVLALLRADLIRETARLPEVEYAFRHGLTQEAAYDSILLKHRRDFHRRVGETTEKLYADRLDEYASLLAHHFMVARDDGRTLKYYVLAGDRALRLYANAEAVMHYDHALEVLERCGPEELAAVSTKTPSAIYRARGLAYETLGEFDKARADHEESLRLACIAGGRHDEWQAHIDLGFLWASRDYNRTGEHFQQALDLARAMAEPALLGTSLNRFGNWLVNVERPREGIQYHEEALTIFERLADRRGLAETLDLLGLACFEAGEVTQASLHYPRAISLFRQLDDQRGLASSLAVWAARSYSYVIETLPNTDIHLDECARDGEEALAVARAIGRRAGEAFALITLGVIWTPAGQYDQALRRLNEGLALAGAIEHHQWMAAGKGGMAGLLLDILEVEKARQVAVEGMIQVRDTGSLIFRYLASADLTRICIGQGDLAAAEAAIEQSPGLMRPPQSGPQRLLLLAYADLLLAQARPAAALEIVEELIATTPEMQPLAVSPFILWRRGQILAVLGRWSEAENDLRDAIQEAGRNRLRPLLWRVHHTLARLYGPQGRSEEAEKEMTAARRIVAELAATIPDEELQANFWQRANDLLSQP